MTAPAGFVYGGPAMAYAQDVRAEQLRRKRLLRAASVGQNRHNSVADLEVVFPWETELRTFSPIVEKVSHLRAYWVRSAQRWVLYDCVPLHLLPDDDRKVRVDMTGAELFTAIRSRPQRLRSDDEEPSPISDLQHEMARRYRVYACPLWVLQGNAGGHQVQLDPWQQNIAIAKGLNPEMPRLGALPPCPFDERVKSQLHRRNRLVALGHSLEKLRNSGNVEAANAEMERIQREIRLAEAAFVEQQMGPLAEMVASVRKVDESQVVRVPDGAGAAAADAWQRYKETGDYTPGLKFGR